MVAVPIFQKVLRADTHRLSPPTPSCAADLVLCRAAEKGETGDRVVALLGGENVTIKYYDKRDGRRILLPKSTNSVHQPIIPEENDTVQGIVQEVIKIINKD